MNKMSSVRLYKKDENFVINFDDTISSRKIMKTSIFLDGIQGICVEKAGNIFSVFMNGLDRYAVATNIGNLLSFLEGSGLEVKVEADIIEMLGEKQSFDREAEKTVAKLSSVKEGIKDDDLDFNNFCSFCDEQLRITLRDYQYKSAYLLSLGNGGFDFSVPGAGKTIITYAAYAYLKEKGMVDKILVVGPGNAFNAWFEEYETCFGEEPDFTNLSFETTKSCQIYLNASGKNHTEISFINFDKLRLSKDAISNFLTKNKALLIVDEAHKVKNPNAAVTKSICEITKYANSRIILTGTPMPNGYEDLSSLFYIFSPFKEIIPYKYAQLKGFTKKGASATELEKIKGAIHPYYSRISKKYLVERGELKNPIFNVVKCHMNQSQIDLYDKLNSFCGKLNDEIDDDFLEYLKKAMLIRKMQISANPALLKKSLVSSMDELHEEYVQYSNNENSEINMLTKADKIITAKLAASEIIRIITSYEQGVIETNKNLMAVKIAEELIKEDKQVLIWDIFISNMNVLRDMLITRLRVNVEIINGSVSGQDRQEAISRFRKGTSKILLANPSTLAESISLHKVCQNAIYVNRNFNAAQFIQSKDRIHRINMPEGTTATYYFLVNADSVDEAVSERLTLKEERMLAILDADDIEVGGAELDDGNIMSAEDIELAYTR